MSERDVVIEGLEAIRDNLSDWDHPINAAEHIDAAVAELTRLGAIVERLPVTADGEPRVPGMEAWAQCPVSGEWVQSSVTTNAYGDFICRLNHAWPGCYRDLSECYSARDAAEAAREGE